MRRIAIINQKGGVGKTTTCANLGAALARLGRRVVVVDMDPQANLTLYLNAETDGTGPTTYSILTQNVPFRDALQATATPNLSLVGSHIDLSGADLELASAFGRETILREAIDTWEREERERTGRAPADYIILDCAPSLGLIAVNALAAAREVMIALQTEFFALQGMSKLVEVVQLLKRRLNPELVITGILPCLYDARLKLGREVLSEIRTYFPGQVFRHPIRTNVKLAESPSYGQTIFEYAPESNGAIDHVRLAMQVLSQEVRDEELAQLPRPKSEEAAIEMARDASAAQTAPASIPAASQPEAASVPVTVQPAPEPSAPQPEPASDPVATQPAPEVEQPSPANDVIVPMPPPAPRIPEPDSAPDSAAHPTTGAPRDTASHPVERPPATPPGPITNSGSSSETGTGRETSTPAPAEDTTPGAADIPPQASSIHTQAPNNAGANHSDNRPAESSSDPVAPAPHPGGHAAPPPSNGARRGPSVVRAKDLPPLPPDAFEAMTSYLRD